MISSVFEQVTNITCFTLVKSSPMISVKGWQSHVLTKIIVWLFLIKLAIQILGIYFCQTALKVVD